MENPQHVLLTVTKANVKRFKRSNRDDVFRVVTTFDKIDNIALYGKQETVLTMATMGF